MRKSLDIVRGMSTAGIDYANIVYSKFRMYSKCLEMVDCKPVLEDLVDGVLL